jgi:hypothetical protein
MVLIDSILSSIKIILALKIFRVASPAIARPGSAARCQHELGVTWVSRRQVGRVLAAYYLRIGPLAGDAATKGSQPIKITNIKQE